MLSKIKLLLISLLLFVTTASALEPLPENRARLSELHGTLLLPDYSYLDFDMSFDCGSRWEHTSMIVTSRAGAELLAASYTHLWGKKAGEKVMQAWENKVNESDPRLPSFLVVSMPTNTSNSTKSSARVSGAVTSKNENITNSESTLNDIPELSATCGTRSHQVGTE